MQDKTLEKLKSLCHNHWVLGYDYEVGTWTIEHAFCSQGYENKDLTKVIDKVYKLHNKGETLEP